MSQETVAGVPRRTGWALWRSVELVRLLLSAHSTLEAVKGSRVLLIVRVL